MQNVIEARFRALLSAAGWTGQSDFEWSLGYCQGDRVAFAGCVEDSAPLIRRLMPNEDGEAIIAGFANRNTFASLEVRKERYGAGISYVKVVLDEADAFVVEDDDSGHEILRKTQAEERLSDLEKLLIEDLRQTERALLRAGYDVYEALNPGFWSKFPDRDEGVLLRRTERTSFSIEWRLSNLDETRLDSEEAEEWQKLIAEGHRGAHLVCVALDADDDEIARSPYYMALLPKTDWTAMNGEVHDLMQCTLADIEDEIRGFLERQDEREAA